MLTVEQALETLLADAAPPDRPETVPLAAARGRVLAESVTADADIPGFDNSALDGYALRTGDLPATGGRLPVSQRIPAGTAAEPLAAGTAARIFTGAMVPPGADAVIAQECTTAGDDSVLVPEPPAPGAAIRHAGHDIPAGRTVLEAGHRLRPQDIGLVASLGRAEVRVHRRLRAAVFTTGDELLEPGERPSPGRIFDANGPMLAALLDSVGVAVADLGRVPDTLEDTIETLERAADADVILTTGGVSVGEEDHIRRAVERLGEIRAWRVRMKPGKPLAYGRVGDTPFLGLPGNPVSAFVTFGLFARPFLLACQGVRDTRPLVLPAIAGFSHPAGERREYLRARLQGGRLALYPNQNSGALSSTSWAEGLAVAPEERPVDPGDPVDFIPFAALLN